MAHDAARTPAPVCARCDVGSLETTNGSRVLLEGECMTGEATNGLVMDLRGLAITVQRPVVFAVVDKMLELDCHDSIVLICGHDPSGIGYQLDLRRESRGCFEFDCDQRLDGAWVALIRRRLC